MRRYKQNRSEIWLGLLLAGAMVCSAAESSGAKPQWTLRTASAPTNLPPIPTIADSPVKFLSTLIEADATQRETLLGARSAERQSFWKRKIAEYEQLPAPIRKERLRTAQLHWYLALLIRLPDDVRANKLLQIPTRDRPLVKRRLDQWNGLSSDLRADILANIKVMQYFARLVTSTAEQRAALLQTSKDPSNPINDTDLSWQSLPSKRRQQMFDAYAKFYQLPVHQQAAAIEKIPVPVRLNFKERLEELSRMPEAERQKCIVALQAYSQMTESERKIFRENADRWRAMSRQERLFWSTYVRQLPPLPPVRAVRARFEDESHVKAPNPGASK